MSSNPTRLGSLAIALVLIVASASATRAQNRPRPERAGGTTLKQPTDPTALKGSWTVAGDRHSITAGDFYELHKLLLALEGSAQQSVTAHRVWEFLLLDDEAKAHGIVVTESDIDRALQKTEDPDLYEGMLQRWSAAGISREQGRRYTAMRARIQRLKDLHLNTMRVTTRDAFDHFKMNRLRYKLEYVMFASEDHAGDLKAEEIDDITLKTFWSQNKNVQNSFRTPNTVTAEFIYLDPAEFTLEKAASVVGGREVTRDQALEYFWANKDLLMQQIPPGKQHLIKVSENTELDEIQTPFSMLEETIKKSLLLEGVIKQAHEEAIAAGGGADLKAIANKLKLGYVSYDEIDRAKGMSEMRRFGFNAFNTLNAATEKTIAAKILNERGVKYFFRLNAKAASRLPRYEEVADKIRRKYIEMKGSDGARKAAQELVRHMTNRAEEVLKPDRAALETEANKRAQERIEQLGITDQAEKNREKMRARAAVHQRLEDKKRTLLPQFFDEYVADKGLEKHYTDHFEFKAVRTNRTEIEDIEESRQLFLESNYYVRTLQIGQVTPIMLEDPTTKAFFVVRLIEKKDPEVSTMGPVDLMQAQAQVKQRREDLFMQYWRYPAIASRLQLAARN